MNYVTQRFTVEGQTAVFVNRSESTRYGFRHISTLATEEAEITGGIRCYYNRTWERYEFESVMWSIANDNLQAVTTRYRLGWMDECGYKRMTSKRWQEWGEYYYSHDLPKDMRFWHGLCFAISRCPTPADIRLENRERDIVRDITDIRLQHWAPDHQVYRIWSGDKFADYDTVNRRFVG